MDLEHRTIGPQDTQWQAAFHRYIERVFPRVSFRRWCEYGGWTENYAAHALTSGPEIVANVSLQRMNVVVHGRDLLAWQLGAVGTIPEWRGRGLQKQILSKVLPELRPADLVFLFANPGVLDFYPRFGFRRVRTSAFGVECRMAPATLRWPQLQVEKPEHRAFLRRTMTSARPATALFGARAYADIALWYWTNFNQEHFYYSHPDNAIIVAEQDGELLRVHDVMAPGAVDLGACLPYVIGSPISRIEFGFTPELLWPDAKPTGNNTSDDDSPLFIREGDRLPEKPFSFPVLAHT